MRARDAIEQVRGKLRAEELKIAFFQNKLEVYENLVDLCLHRPDGAEEAFGYIEQAKSRALMDLLSQSVRVSTTSDPGQSELVRSIRNFREELNWYYNLIEREQLRPEERSQERIKQLEQQARAREADLMRALKEATVAEAHDAGVQVASTSSLEQIRAALPADTALVEYFRIQDRIVTCVLTHDQLQIVPVTVRSRVQKLLHLLQLQMSKFRLNQDYLATFGEAMAISTQGHLKDLYQELIAPIRHLLDAKHLVFVPHGLLHYLPFHALHDGTSYLIDSHTISYAPSASVYAVCQNKQDRCVGRFADSWCSRCAGSLHPDGSRGSEPDPAGCQAVCRRVCDRRCFANRGTAGPDRAHRHPWLFPSRQSNVFVDSAGRLAPGSL